MLNSRSDVGCIGALFVWALACGCEEAKSGSDRIAVDGQIGSAGQIASELTHSGGFAGNGSHVDDGGVGSFRSAAGSVSADSGAGGSSGAGGRNSSVVAAGESGAAGCSSSAAASGTHAGDAGIAAQSGSRSGAASTHGGQAPEGVSDSEGVAGRAALVAAPYWVDDGPTATLAGELSLHQGSKPWSGYIGVCFLATSGKELDFSDEVRARIRRTVTDTWNRVAQVTFEYFGPCLATSVRPNNVHLTLDRSLAPQQLGAIDKLGNPGQSGAVSTIRFADPNPSRRTIIHLFGHALGFPHPQSDAACGPAETGRSPDDKELSSSVMSQSPCYAVDDLTPTDVVAVQNAYQRRAPGSLVGMNAQCLDAVLPVLNGFSVVEVHICHGGENQRWNMHGNGSFQCLHRDVSSLLLDVYGGGIQDGTAVELREPNQEVTANQTWTFENVEIRGIGNLCVGTTGGGSAAGQLLEVAACHGQSNQRWRIEWLSDTALRVRDYPGASHCVTVGTDPNRLELAPCSSSPEQEFEISALGELKFGGLCWSSEGADCRSGRVVSLEACMPAGSINRHQQYFLRGWFQSNVSTSNRPICLTTSNSDFHWSDRTYTYGCQDSPDFVWDYYFNPP